MNYDNSIPENTKDQFDIAMRDFDTCLKAAGGDFSSVTKVRVFLTNIMIEKLLIQKELNILGNTNLHLLY